jgi:NADPH:quinone reductase-like Zn-dependent oxidoreductase
MHTGGRRSLITAGRTLLAMPRFHPITLMNDNRSVSGVNLGHLWGEVPLMRSEMQALVELYRAGHIKPHIDSVFPLERAGEAHQRIQSRGNVGKVLLST